MNKLDPKLLSQYMSSLGKKGGKTTKERYGRGHFVNIAKSRKGMTWKWSPDKKGKRGKKSDGLQSVVEHDNMPADVIDSITPPIN